MGKSKIPGYLRKVAFLEVNLLLSEGLLPAEFEGLCLQGEDKIFGQNDYELMRRLRLVDPSGRVSGFIEYAINPIYAGAVLLAVGLGDGTIREDILNEIKLNGDESGEGGSSSEPVQLVVYDYPKLGLRSPGSEEIRDLSSLEIVKEGGPGETADSGKGKGLRRELSQAQIDERGRRFAAEKEFWRPIIEAAPINAQWNELSQRWFQHITEGSALFRSKRLSKVVDSVDPDQGMGLSGQKCNDWCFAACVQSILSFYHYEYEQGILAYVLGLKPCGSSNGIPKSAQHNVVVTLEKMSRGALEGTMVREPDWDDFRTEIEAGRPVIGLLDSHCRVIIGASLVEAISGSGPGAANLNLKGLTILDPWPVDRGTVICWENFDAFNYVASFGARPNLLSEKEIGLPEYILRQANEYLAQYFPDWNLTNTSRAVSVEKLDPQGRTTGWLATIEDQGEVPGFIRLGEDLSVRGFYSSRSGGSFIERSVAESKILQLAEPDEDIGKSRLTFDDKNDLLWHARARKSGAREREIRLDEFKVPTEAPE